VVSRERGAAEWAIAAVVGVALYAVIAVSLLRQPLEFSTPVVRRHREAQTADPEYSTNSIATGLAFMNVEDATPKANLTGIPSGHEHPDRKRMGYLLPFEIVSVHLLVVLIAAGYLARAKRRAGGEAWTKMAWIIYSRWATE